MSEEAHELESEVDVLLDRVAVTLGGRTVYLRRLPLSETRVWRERFAGFLAPLLERATAADAVVGTGKNATIDVGKVMRAVLPYMMGEGLEELVALAPLYDPALSEPWEGASDQERVKVAVTVLEEMLPFVEHILAAQAKLLGQAMGKT